MLINKLYNAPAFRLFLFFGIGIIIGKEYTFSPFVVLLLIIFCLVYLFLHNNIHHASAVIVISTTIILAGIVKSNYDFFSVDKKSLLNLSYNHPGVFLEGVVSDLPEKGTDKLQFRLSSERLISSEDTLETTGDVLVTVKQAKEISDTCSPVIPEAGDRVILYGDLVDAPEEVNPGEFNYRNYLILNDIQKTFRVHFTDDMEITGKNELGFIKMHLILPARKYAIENINNYVGGNEGAFLNGLVTGYRNDIPREMKDDFVKAGVMHILAVSGLNVAYVILMLSFILSMFRAGLRTKIFLYTGSLLFYTYFAGASASIIRAVIMGSLMLMVLLVQRKPNFYNIIGASALIILAIDTRQLFNPGFILTYASVLSIVIFMDKINTSFPESDRRLKGFRHAMNKLLMLILSGIAAQLGVMPITVYYFSKISMSGIITNLAAIPLSNLSLGLGFFQIVTGLISPYLCGIIADTNTMLLKFQLWFIHEMAALKFSHIEYYGISFAAIFVFYLVLIIAVISERKNIFSAAISSLIIICAFIVFTGMKDDKLRITFLSLGNADCTHIETPDGSNILIDAGIENPYNHSCTKRIIPYLKYKRVQDIDLLIITSDIGKNYYSLKSLTDNFRIKKILYGYQRKADSRVLSLISDCCGEIINSKDADIIRGFGNMELGIIKNTDSGVFMVKVLYGKNSLLFTGAAEINDEKEYMKLDRNVIRADIIKIASYGSEKSSSSEFLAAVSPSASVISSRLTNGRNTPSQVTLEKLKGLGIRIYRTDIENALIFESDGESITLER